jgi:hypothetical protein
MATIIAVAAVVVWSHIAAKGTPKPTGRQTVAYLVLAGGLFLLADVAPAFAGPLALLFGIAIVTSEIPTGKSKFFSTYTSPEPSGGTQFGETAGAYHSPTGHPVGG